MRISDLAETTGVPVHTLKYYLREGLLMPGEATSRTRAEYGPEHVERVRLVRALVEHGGIGIAGVRSILTALSAPPPSRHDLLGVAQYALLTATGEEVLPAVSPEVADLLDDAGWAVCGDAPAARTLTTAISAARDAGIPLPPAVLKRYAAAMADVAAVDLDEALSAASIEAAMHTVVVGTVMVDPVLIALRRLAQEAANASRWSAAERHGPNPNTSATGNMTMP